MMCNKVVVKWRMRNTASIHVRTNSDKAKRNVVFDFGADVRSRAFCPILCVTSCVLRCCAVHCRCHLRAASSSPAVGQVAASGDTSALKLGTGSKTGDAANCCAAKAVRQERLKVARDQYERERQRKILEILESQKSALEFRERQKEERRKRIEDMKRREDERRQMVEDRRRRMQVTTTLLLFFYPYNSDLVSKCRNFVTCCMIESK